MVILLGDSSAQVGRDEIFKPTTGNETLHLISNDNEIKVVNLPRQKSDRQEYSVPTS
jgi:hypothetical protein